LVLDDPLQHNDTIHAAAFADFVCNLVVSRGYQVLLSTHDRAQAEFLRRKMASRNLPCTVLNLLGAGQDGVEWTYRSADSVAPLFASA
jgi:ABC-type nitrate/sulfonate/bicarbonate transport system ATPase subunit